MIWKISIKEGFTTLNQNRKLIGIALISVVLGKIIDLIEQLTDKTLYETDCCECQYREITICA